MAVPFSLPSREDAHEDYLVLHRLLISLYDALRQILLRQRLLPPQDVAPSDNPREDDDPAEDGGGGEDGGGEEQRVAHGNAPLPNLLFHAQAALGSEGPAPDLVAGLPLSNSAGSRSAPAGPVAPAAAPNAAAPRGSQRRRRQRKQSQQQQPPQPPQQENRQPQRPQEPQQPVQQRRRNKLRQNRRQRRSSGSDSPQSPATAAAASPAASPAAAAAACRTSAIPYTAPPALVDWSLMGEELRRIADQFQACRSGANLKEPPEQGEAERNVARRRGRSVPWRRLLPLLVLPPAVHPRPLWAAVLLLLGLKLAHAILKR